MLATRAGHWPLGTLWNSKNNTQLKPLPCWKTAIFDVAGMPECLIFLVSSDCVKLGNRPIIPAKVGKSQSDSYRCHCNISLFRFRICVLFHPIFSSFGFWYFSHFSCTIFFPVFFRLAHLALQNVIKDYVIFSYFWDFVAKSDQKPKTKNRMNKTWATITFADEIFK